jgi:hypothetical protein
MTETPATTANTVIRVARLAAGLALCFGIAAVALPAATWVQMWLLAGMLGFAGKAAVLRRVVSERSAGVPRALCSDNDRLCVPPKGKLWQGKVLAEPASEALKGRDITAQGKLALASATLGKQRSKAGRTPAMPATVAHRALLPAEPAAKRCRGKEGICQRPGQHGDGFARPVSAIQPRVALTSARLPWALMCRPFRASEAGCASDFKTWPSPKTLPSAAAFVLLWPGMSWGQWMMPAVAGEEARRWLWDGLLNLALGTALLFGVARQFDDAFAATWVAMIGFIFVMHCGVFTLMAVAWQRLGRGVRPIMKCPVAAASVTEFWGARWNLAFHDLARATVLKPVARRYDVAVASWAVFVVSGLAHELVISVPAHGGYGGPTLYFLIQGVGHALERRCSISKSSLLWRLRAWACCALPLPLLFHPPFVLRVIRPFFTAIHALP